MFFFKCTLIEWNRLPGDCVNTTSVNMFNNAQDRLIDILKDLGIFKGTRHKQNSLSGNTLFNYMPTYTRSQKKS